MKCKIKQVDPDISSDKRQWLKGYEAALKSVVIGTPYQNPGESE